MRLIKRDIIRNIYFFFIILFLIIIKFSTINTFADNYTVTNIKVKEQYGINFNKQKVINKGFEKAFKILIFKIVENNDKKLFNNISRKKITSLIDNFSISNEKFINNNYEVDIQVKFDKKKLLSFIRNKKVISSVPKKTEALIIPILIDTNNNEIKYFNQNYFFNNWNNINKKYFLINYNLPDEDIEDFQKFQKFKDNIESYNFLDIIKKYNFDNIVIVIFYKNKNNLKIFSKINFSNLIFNLNLNQNNINFEDKKKLNKLIFDLKNIYEDKWKIVNKINTLISIPIIISISNNNYKMSERLEKVLSNSDFVNEYKIEKIGSNTTIYKIIYNSNPEKLLNKLAINDINIISSNNEWKIK